MAPRSKPKSIDRRIAELEEHIAELKDRIRSRDAFSPEKVRRLRRRLQLSGADLAELLDVSLVTVYSWENGRSIPRAAQRRRLEEAEELSKEQAWKRLGIVEVDDAGFSPEALRAERERLGLSARKYGRLIGVTMLTIYNWEKGRAFPRPKQLERWGEVKGISPKEAERRLAAAR